MEYELIESSEMDSKTGNLAVTEEADVDEAISIYLKKERNTHKCKDKLDIDIEKINTHELINKLNTIKQRPIYEVIDEAYFMESNIFSDALCKNARIMQMKINLSHLR